MRYVARSSVVPVLSMLCVILVGRAPCAMAETASLTAVQDNTLYQYDPSNPDSLFNSNGIGNFFSAGCTFSRSQIQRGLLRFDFSGLPAGATVVPGTVQLNLYVLDVPKKDTSPRPFWLVPLTGLGQPWGEGNSLANLGSGAGSGAPAEPGDATWFHTQYNPPDHDQETFVPGGAGFWPQMGALGNDALDPWTLYGSPDGTAGGANGPLALSSGSMADAIQAWLQNPASNFGWIVLGDETVNSTSLSSKRGFATHEHTDPAYHPQLTFEYSVMAQAPEPASILPLLIGSILLLGYRRWR